LLWGAGGFAVAQGHPYRVQKLLLGKG